LRRQVKKSSSSTEASGPFRKKACWKTGELAAAEDDDEHDPGEGQLARDVVGFGSVVAHRALGDPLHEPRPGRHLDDDADDAAAAALDHEADVGGHETPGLRSAADVGDAFEQRVDAGPAHLPPFCRQTAQSSASSMIDARAAPFWPANLTNSSR
jgi:hypothetical protein